MDCLCKQFLSRSALSEDQRMRQISRSNIYRIFCLQHLIRLTDDIIA